MLQLAVRAGQLLIMARHVALQQAQLVVMLGQALFEPGQVRHVFDDVNQTLNRAAVTPIGNTVMVRYKVRPSGISRFTQVSW